MLVISAVLAVQCVLLGDGGLSALGANVLNMAVLGSLLGWPVWKISRGAATPARRAAAAALAGAAALPLGAVACAIEMHAAGRADFTATVGRMIPLHLILGVAEGLFTAAAVWAMAKKPTVMAITMRRNVLAVSSIIAIVAVLAPFSSALPDTLEAAVESLGVASSEPLSGAAVDAAAFAFVGTWAATTLPIVLGTLIAVAAVVLLERGLSRSAVKAPRRRDVR
jgi:cobalt/nickel transport system permease protein